MCLHSLTWFSALQWSSFPSPLEFVEIQKMLHSGFTPPVGACLFLKVSDFTPACPGPAHVNDQTVEFNELSSSYFFSIKYKHPNCEPHLHCAAPCVTLSASKEHDCSHSFTFTLLCTAETTGQHLSNATEL